MQMLRFWSILFTGNQGNSSCRASTEDNIPVDISEDVVGLTGVGNSMLVCILFELNAKTWSGIFSDITDTTKFGTPKNFAKVVKKVNRYSLIYFVYCMVGIVIYGLVAMLDTGRCERLNKEKGLHEICGTVTPFWWPNDEISPLAKTIIILCQIFSAVYYIPPSAILVFVAWESAEVLIAKIHHVKELFENAFDTKDKDLQIQRLKYCIRYHQEIVRVADDLNKAGRKVCGQLSFVGAIILSCIGTQMLKEYSIGAVIHLMGYGVAVFLVCQTGQKMRDETCDIQDAVYLSQWYEVNPKLAKDTQLILLRCQKPVCMEAIPFGVFNYNLLIIAKIDEAFYYTTMVARSLHYYPVGVKETNLKYYHAVSIVLRILCSFIWIECAIHCTMAIKNKTPVDISEDVAHIAGLSNSMFICILFELNAKTWSGIFSDITDTTKFGTPKNFVKVVKKVNRYSLIYLVYCMVGLVIYALVASLDTGRCKRLNKERGLHEICGTVSSLWWPNDEISPMAKIVVALSQVISAVFYVPPSAILTFLAWESAEVLITKIHHVKELFENAFDTKEDDLQIRRLKYCIKYHQEIIRIADNLNKASRKLCGQLSFLGAIILSCIGTQMLKEYSVGAMLHLMGYGVALFFLCQCGQKVRDETYDIQDAVYASQWYEVNPKLAIDAQLILLRCQKPVCMEAMPFGVFNYNLLIIIIKTSYSYLTLINSSTDG